MRMMMIAIKKTKWLKSLGTMEEPAVGSGTLPIQSGTFLGIEEPIKGLRNCFPHF